MRRGGGAGGRSRGGGVGVRGRRGLRGNRKDAWKNILGAEWDIEEF